MTRTSWNGGDEQTGAGVPPGKLTIGSLCRQSLIQRRRDFAGILLGVLLFGLPCEAAERKEFAPPVLAFVENQAGANLVTVAGKKMDLKGLVEFYQKQASRFGAIGGLSVVFKGDLSLDEFLKIHKTLSEAKLTPVRMFVCPEELWQPRAVTPAQWQEISLSNLKSGETGQR